jgi:hypothetical protein
MFRCDNCGSRFSIMAAARWDACPRCLARDQVRVPLTFELGGRAADTGDEEPQPEERSGGDDDSGRDATIR